MGTADPGRSKCETARPLRKHRLKLLAVGHAMIPTGFARVLHNLLPWLATYFEVHHFAPNYSGSVPDLPWRIHPNPNPHDVHGAEGLHDLVSEVQPDVILLLQDPWIVPVYLGAIRSSGVSARTVVYCPVDAPFMDPTPLHWAREVDGIVAYTEFGKNTLIEALNYLMPSGEQPLLSVIPHGTDTESFYPTCDGVPAPNAISGPAADLRRVQARRALYGKEMSGQFIVLNASRNQPRKRLDLTIAGFAQFAAGKDDVWLHLHTERKGLGCDVEAIAKAHGVGDRLLLPPAVTDHPDLRVWDLNLLYNACDVGVNTASGEGWGLVSFEHAATGAAQIVPGHGACCELWFGSALLLDVGKREPMGCFLEAAVISPPSLANALERLYSDRVLRDKMAHAAYENSTEDRLLWSRIAEQWAAFLLA